MVSVALLTKEIGISTPLSTKYHSMCGSEIDIVQETAKEATRLYRT